MRGGAIAQLRAPGTLTAGDDVEVVEGDGRLYALPAFFDPHVHLRSPGQEHKEDIESGTSAAAAGGYGAVIAMPNTDPPIDSPELLRSVRETAALAGARASRLPPALTRGLDGAQLTEMAALREQGALGFTDDGHPVASAGVLREALQRQRECGGRDRAARGGPLAFARGRDARGRAQRGARHPRHPLRQRGEHGRARRGARRAARAPACTSST